MELREHFAFDNEHWRNDAACRGYPTTWWYPQRGNRIATTKQAHEICTRCPVTEQCLQSAIIRFEEGIWGGVNIRERRSIRNQKQLRKRLVCQHCRQIFERPTKSGVYHYCSRSCKNAAHSIRVLQRRRNNPNR